MILSDDTLFVAAEYAVYRTAPKRKLGVIAKDDNGQFRFIPSGIVLTGKDVKFIERHIETATKFDK